MQEGQAAPHISLHTLLGYCVERDSIIHSLKTAVFVGTLLTIINHGGNILAGGLTWRDMIPVLLTYLVPFVVAMSGIIHAKKSMMRNLARIPNKHRQGCPESEI